MKNVSILSVLVISLSLLACQSGAEAPAEAKPAASKEAKALTPKNTPAKAAKPKPADPAKLRPRPMPAPDDVAAAPADASTTASGLASKVIVQGSGTVNPKAEDTVEVHYTGWTTDGKMFDSSVLRGKPAQFPLYGVIKGWTEGVQLMVPGEKTRFWIPAELAYGNKPGRPAGMLVFDIELLKIL